jgi:hypothetical protein
MAVLASSRTGNFVRAIFVIAVITLIFREIFLLWFFHTASWTSRPAEMKYCGHWYERESGLADQTHAQSEALAGGPLKKVWRSPVINPVLAHKPGSACPRLLFAQVSHNGYVAYLISN